MKQNIKIIARKSPLAQIQAKQVKACLLQHFPKLNFNIEGITTTGDKILDKPLSKIGGKGLFMKELEEPLLAGHADFAVHSMKDIPANLPPGLVIAAVLPRANPFDVLLSKHGHSIMQLADDAIVGTSSMRRQAQVLALKPKLKIKSIRGNIETRINKLKHQQFDAIILAQAALERLQLNTLPHYTFNQHEMLPAVGQGIIGVECRENDKFIIELLAKISDINTEYCVTAERSMNTTLNGDCSTPIAGFAEILAADKLQLSGLVAATDGKKILQASTILPITEAFELGKQVALSLLEQGAQELIAKSP